MDKDKAREMLENSFGRTFPIFDKIIQEDWSDANNLNIYTFRGLLKIAYDLQDIDPSEENVQLP